MKWLTQTEITEAAKNIDTAMDCSVKHWYQMATATFRELVWAARNKGDLPHRKFCPLCTLYWGTQKSKDTDCVKCPVYKFSGRYCSSSPYSTAWRAWRYFKKSSTLPNYLKFHKAAQAEYRFLLKVRKWHKEQK